MLEDKPRSQYQEPNNSKDSAWCEPTGFLFFFWSSRIVHRHVCTLSIFWTKNNKKAPDPEAKGWTGALFWEDATVHGCNGNKKPTEWSAPWGCCWISPSLPLSVAHGSDWRSVPGEVARWIPGTNRPCRVWTNVKSSYCWRQQYDPATSSFLPPVQVFPSLWSHFLTSLFECIRKKYHTKKEKTREDAFERATKKAQKVPGLSSCLW